MLRSTYRRRFAFASAGSIAGVLPLALGWSGSARAAPGDLLVGRNADVVAFQSGGNLGTKPAFATLANTVTGLCVGPGGALFAAIAPNQIVDITAGGDLGSAAPFATLPAEIMDIACDEGHLYAFSYQTSNVYDATAGGSIGAAFAFNMSPGPLGPATDLFMHPGGALLALRNSTVIDISAGGDVSSLSPYASFAGNPGPFGFLIGGDAFAGEMWLAAYNGAAYSMSDAGGTIPATPHASGLANPFRIVASPAGVFVYDQQAAAIYDVTAGGAPGAPFVTNVPGPFATMIYVPQCGDGYAQSIEACDGNGIGTGGETAACDADCSPAQCGDGHVNGAAGEACDDGNGDAGDGCDAACQIEDPGTGGAGGEGGGGEGGIGGDGGAGEGGAGEGGAGEGGAGGAGASGGVGVGPDVCSPGQQIECACPGGALGAQACDAQGDGYDACVCPGDPGAPAASADGDDGGCAVRAPRGVADWPEAWSLMALAVGVVCWRRRRHQR